MSRIEKLKLTHYRTNGELDFWAEAF